MAGGGYNISASISPTTPSASGIASAFSATGGGNYGGVSYGPASIVTQSGGTASAPTLGTYLPWLILGIVAIVFLIFFMPGGRKK